MNSPPGVACVTFYLQKITIYSLACKLARMEKSTARASDNPSNTIFYWLPLSIAGRNLRSSLSRLSLSFCNIYLAFSLSSSILSSEGFSLCLHLCKTAPEFGLFDFITVHHTLY